MIFVVIFPSRAYWSNIQVAVLVFNQVSSARKLRTRIESKLKHVKFATFWKQSTKSTDQRNVTFQIIAKNLQIHTFGKWKRSFGKSFLDELMNAHILRT